VQASLMMIRIYNHHIFRVQAIGEGLYYKHITIVNDNTSIVNKFEASLTDDTRLIIYNRHKFIVKPTGI
jgi:hypothetical protein